ncbi:MAG: R3H domain-containing nucleic acid-binding protein [Cyanobacteria bacterium J06621_8]
MESQLSSGTEWLQQLLSLMGLAAEVTAIDPESEDASGLCWLDIDSSNFTSEQKLLFIGDRGESIDAVQYLVNTILNLSSELEEQSSFVVELDGYRLNRNRELAALTQEAIEKVSATGQEFEIAGLSSAERKQIHSLLQNVENLTTESRGQEPNRKIVVLPQ